ncbi:MAG: hypothetical protein K2H25_01360 [Alistipes sp.]|nr:hypothetical protein [Alistipes sp.]
MKRHLFYLLALMLTVTASCSKDPEGLDVTTEPAAEGKYRLATLSATLDGEQTRTGEPNATTGAVNWSAKDRILIIRTSDYATWQYELVKGASTPIGEFEPIIGGSEATSNDPAFGDIIAVYPVAAAYVDTASKKLSFRINQNWYPENTAEATAWKERLSGLGITSWTKDTAHAFTQNDIKVSYKCTPVTDSQNIASANFKFRQLGAWCKFEFDFTSDETIAMESLRSLRVTTVGGNVHFTGKAEVQLADDTNANPTLRSAGDATEVYWQFSTPSSMASPFTRSMMMYPGELDGQRLKIVAETNLHTFTFYATPKLSLQAGTVYHFPISLGFQDYEQDDMGAAQATDLAYTMVEKELKPFYYYGEHNSYIVKPNVATTVDCKPYKSDAYYHKTGTAATLDAANRPTQAKVIWYETAMGAPTLGAFNASNYTFTVTTPAGKYGNALVGVYNAAGKILWSYHIWVPQDDPTQTLTYANTRSGAYEVMPLALGATKVAVKGEAPTADKRIDGAGLWYQWGRKDPLGRPAYWGNGSATTPGAVAVTVNANTLPGIDAVDNNGYFFTEQNAGAGNTISLNDELVQSGYADYVDGSILIDSKIEETLPNGTKVFVSTDRHMIDISIENPTKFVTTASASTAESWTDVWNYSLWGNPTGNTFPRISQTYKSVLDPCPQGYRVAPMDVWTNFTTLGVSTTSIYEYNVATTITSVDIGIQINNKKNGTSIYKDGQAIGFTPPTGEHVATDFYLLTGVRNADSGKPHLVGSYIYYGCSYPLSLRINTGGELSMQYKENLGRARQIRCVKEPQH